MITPATARAVRNERTVTQRPRVGRLLDQLNEVVHDRRWDGCNERQSGRGITGIPTSDAIGHDVVGLRVVEEERDQPLRATTKSFDGCRATAQHEAWFRTAENEKR